MGIFDNLNQPANSVPQYPVQGGNRSVNVVFPQLRLGNGRHQG